MGFVRSPRGIAAVMAAAASALLVPAQAHARVDTGLNTPPGIAKHLYPTVPRATQLHGELSVGGGAGPLLWNGGAIQKTPRVYLDFWGFKGNDSSGEQAILTSFFSGVGGSGWANIQTQYHGTSGQGNVTNPGGQLAGVWDDNTSTPLNVIADLQIAKEAVRAERHFGYSPDADYIVATPSGHSTAGFMVQYCAWHSMTTDGPNNVAYTNLPYITDAKSLCGANFVNPGPAGKTDGITIVAGHEYAEAITDPDTTTGWYDKSGNETGDKCAWISSGSGAARNIALSTGTFPVQTLYSNAASATGACVISYP